MGKRTSVLPRGPAHFLPINDPTLPVDLFPTPTAASMKAMG